MEPIDNVISPYECWTIAEAIYEDNSVLEKTKEAVNSYLKNHTQEKIKLLELDRISACPWVLGLFCIQKGNRKVLVVSFQGTKNAIQWIDNAVNSVLVAKMLMKSMKKTIQAWENKYTKKYDKKYQKPEWGRIMAFTGHSRGGQFASRCWKNKRLWRISWNGYDVLESRYRINLATNGDPLTTTDGLCNPEKYIRICDGGHSLYDFKKTIKGTTWKQLLPEEEEKPRGFFLRQKNDSSLHFRLR